jgi:hypothetical protein
MMNAVEAMTNALKVASIKEEQTPVQHREVTTNKEMYTAMRQSGQHYYRIESLWCCQG